MNAMTENAFSFGCEGEALVGIVHSPHAPRELGVVVIVGGPQYRAGSHRHFVLLARALAASGFAVLRFDVRGMGDSSGPHRNFEAVGADIGAAIDALQAQVPEVRRVVLWGLCDGASAALLYLHDTADRRVDGLCLLNPWVRTEAGLARTHVKHYYTQRLRQREFWAKLLRGQVGGKAWSGFLANLRAQRGTAQVRGDGSFQGRMAKAWAAFDKSILLMLSGDDYTAKEFVEFASASTEWKRQFERARFERVDLPYADHTLSSAGDRAALEHAMIGWLGKCRYASNAAAS
jgi:exosortase A-associated hydrolase 1